MKELIGIFLVGLFGFAIWQTRQAATIAPRCPTLDELEAINRDVFEGKTDLVDAENLARSYDAIKGCEGAATSIRATILAVKSKGTLAKAPDASFSLTVSPDLVGKAPVVDPGILLVDTSYGKEIDALSIDALSSPLREDAKRLLATPRGEWSATDLAIYKTLTGAGGTPSEGCGGLPEGEILLDWFSRKAFVCNPSLDELEAGVRKTFLADHPDNAYDVLRKHYFGVV